MPQTSDPERLMQRFYPLLGGKTNVLKQSRQGSRFTFLIKDQSLADTAALADLPEVAGCSLRSGRVLLELEAETYQKAKKENLLMASKYDGLARIIIQNVGGKSNINGVKHCVTRLRFDLKDVSKANTEVLKETDGVVTVIQAGGQYQVVIGNQVPDVYDAVISVGHLESLASGTVDEDGNAVDDGGDGGKKKKPLAILLKTKNEKLKKTAIPAFISGIFGVTEPAIYGVTLPKKTPFVISCVAGAIGGAYAAVTNVTGYMMGGLGLFGLPGYINPNPAAGENAMTSVVNALISVVIACVVGFVLTWFTYKDDAPAKKA